MSRHSDEEDQDLIGGPLLGKGPCWRDECGSSDACAHYGPPRERYYCFSCRHAKFVEDGPRGSMPDTESKPSGAKPSGEIQALIAKASPRALADRRLTQESCRKWDYLSLNRSGVSVQAAVYRDAKGVPVGVKIRDPSKPKDEGIKWAVGQAKGQLYGRHLWGSGGKKLVITEGEIDAITVSQMQNHQWPVVSVPNGAAEATKAIAKNLEWINSFEEVLLGFDMDQQGRDACVACAELLPPGKAKIIKWTEKDPNEMLTQGKGDQITKCVWSAEAFRPDGILDARTLTDACMGKPLWGTPYPYQFLTEWTYGARGGQVVTLGAGYGIGKTDVENEFAACFLTGKTRYGVTFPPEPVGIFAYESGAAGTKKAIAGKIFGKRFHIPQDEDCPEWTTEDLRAAMTDMDGPIWDAGGKLFINDSKGAADWDTVKDRIRFLRYAEDVRKFFIDPLSAMVEEGDVDGTGERKIIDAIMRESAKLAVELDSTLFIFSHLTRPKDGPSHEEGGQVRGSQFRGSNAIGMFSDFILGAERNTQADDQAERAIMRLRMVKDRLTGSHTGKVAGIVYDSITGVYDVPASIGDFAG